jgi:periplasmic divalent cation tolerance protein
MNCILIYSTFPTPADAEHAARALLDEQLVAGANIFPAHSIFRWQGHIEDRQEAAVLFQAERRFYKRIERRIKQLHQDAVPQIVMWRIKDGLVPFLQWIMDETVRPVEKRERKQKAVQAKEAARSLRKPRPDAKPTT